MAPLKTLLPLILSREERSPDNAKPRKRCRAIEFMSLSDKESQGLPKTFPSPFSGTPFATNRVFRLLKFVEMMGSTGSMSTAWLILLLLSSCFHCYFAAHHGREDLQQQSSVVVVGTVHLDSMPKNFISGAPVNFECADTTSRLIFQQQAVTDRHGEFRVRLPLELSSYLNSITSCSLQLLRANAEHCATAATSTALRLVATKRNGIRVFSAGSFAVQTSTRPELCSQKGFFFPPIPFVPEPPNIGGAPIPPNPLMPSPPSLLPPNPLMPAPPPLLPPLPFQPPPPPPFINIPPLLPFLAPPPPPPPPKLPFIPPLPFFQPTPPFPSVPPASTSKKRSGSP